jgi:hypothetical protein
MLGQCLEDVIYETWLTPRRALTFVQGTFPDINVASRAIYQHILGGQIRTAARTNSLNNDLFSIIPTDHWNHRQDMQSGDWWDTGTIHVHLVTSRDYKGTPRWHHIRYFGVRFDPAGVGVVIADAPRHVTPRQADAGASKPKPEPVPVHDKGGRPRKEFWDDLLIAMFEKFWLESFTPRTQADVERAMLDWVSNNGEKLSESTVKVPARKLWKLFQKGEGSKT